MKKKILFLLMAVLMLVLIKTPASAEEKDSSGIRYAAEQLTLPEVSSPRSDVSAKIIKGEDLLARMTGVNETRYFTFTVNESGWFLLKLTSDLATYETLYKNPSMTMKVIRTYDRTDKDNLVSHEYYLEKGTYYFSLYHYASEDTYCFAYFLPDSKTWENSLTKVNASSYKFVATPKGEQAYTQITQGIVGAEDVRNSLWNKAQTSADDTFSITENGEYTVRVGFNSTEWKDYFALKSFTITDIVKGPSEFNTINAKDINVTAKKKAQTVKIKASALGNAKLSFSNKKIKISSNGVATIPAKYVGTLTVKITSAATDKYYKTSKDIRINVKPAKPSLKKVTSKTKKKVYVNWNTVDVCDGYEVQYSTKKNMKGAKTVSVKNAKAKSCEIKLKSKKTYYVRVRAYKKASGKKIYSDFSTIKKVKVK